MTELLLMDTVDLKIFNKEGKLLTEINHNIQSVLDLGKQYFGVNNGLLNIELLKLMSKHNNKGSKMSDFDKVLNNKTTIKFSSQSNLDSLKIIANGVLYSPDTQKISHKFNLVIHNARISNSHKLDFKVAEVYSPSFTFKFSEDESGEYVDLVLEEIK